MLEELKKCIHQVCPEADLSAVDEDTSLGEDLGIDSIRMVMLAIDIENRFGIRMKDFPGVKTVGELMALIRSSYEK